jgi:hypothetical protein
MTPYVDPDADFTPADAEHERFLDWCSDNDVDPEDDDALSDFRESEEEDEDPYASRGLRMRDFL